MPSSEDIVLWPDDTACFREELHSFSWKSDDYEIIPVGSERYDALLQLHFCP